MKQAVIDTNVYLHAILEESSLHIKAKEVLNEVEVWLTPIIVIYELIWVFKKLQVSIEDIHNVILALLENPRVKVIPDDSTYTRRALILLKKEKLNTAMFNDKLILLIAKYTNSPLITFDKELAEQAKTMKGLV